jgi:tetratricopeptide (TPR) repeat protein
VAAALIAGAAVSTRMYFQEKQALVRSRQVSTFLQQVLAEAGPLKAQGRDTTMMREILDQTAARIGKELADQPEVQAELRSTLGETYCLLAEYASAAEQHAEAVRLRRLSHRGDEVLAYALYLKARPLIGLGRWQEAVDAFAEALAIRQHLYGEDHLLTATLRGEMAWPLMNLGRVPEAERCARLATAKWRTLPDQTMLLGGPRSLAMILHREHRYEECLAICREELAGIQRALGPEHPTVVNTLDNLGYYLLDVNGYDEAEPIMRDALRQSLKFFPNHEAGHTHILASLLRILAHRGDWDGQLKLARESMARCQAETPRDPADTHAATGTLARVLLEQAEHFAESDPKRALALLDELDSSKELEPVAKRESGWVYCLRGMALADDETGRKEAKALLTRGLAAMKRKEKPTAQETQRIRKVETALAGR